MKYCDVNKAAKKLRRNQTPSERKLWARLKNRQLQGYKFLRQHPLFYNREGIDIKFFVPDFYCAKVKLAIELDGPVHDDTLEHDRWRDEILQSKGIRVLRIKNEELKEMDKVSEKITGALTSPPGLGIDGHPPRPSATPP